MATQTHTYGPQQPAGFNFGAFNNFLDGQQSRDTPFQTDMLKRGAAGFGDAIGGAMGQLGAGLNANANRMAQQQGQADSWASSQGMLPPGMAQSQIASAGNPFQMWLNLNKQMQQGKTGANLAAQKQQDDYENSQGRINFDARFPRMQKQGDLMASLFSRIMGAGSGAGGGGFNTNFGASGSY